MNKYKLHVFIEGLDTINFEMETTQESIDFISSEEWETITLTNTKGLDIFLNKKYVQMITFEKIDNTN